MHGLPEIDGVQHAHFIASGGQHFPALHDQRPLGVGDHQRGALGFRALHDVGFHKKAGLAAARAADHQRILIARIPWVFGAAVQGQALSLGQDHVVPGVGVDERLDIARLAPTRGAILGIAPVLLGVSAFFIDCQPQ